MPIWPIPFIICTTITQKMMIFHTQFPGQKAEDQCHRGCSNLRSHGLFNFFVMPVLWLGVYLTDSFHIWHNYNPWALDVLHTASISKGQRYRSQAVRRFGHTNSVFPNLLSQSCCISPPPWNSKDNSLVWGFSMLILTPYMAVEGASDPLLSSSPGSKFISS